LFNAAASIHRTLEIKFNQEKKMKICMALLEEKKKEPEVEEVQERGVRRRVRDMGSSE